MIPQGGTAARPAQSQKVHAPAYYKQEMQKVLDVLPEDVRVSHAFHLALESCRHVCNMSGVALVSGSCRARCHASSLIL